MPEAAVAQPTPQPKAAPPGPGQEGFADRPVHDRLKALLSQPPEPTTSDTTTDSEQADPEASSVAPQPKTPQPAKEPKQQAQEPAAEEQAPADETARDDAQTEELQLSSLNDLAEATGLELDKLMDLELPTKIDGKDGTARLRDLVRSYQLDGHINQKLATLDNDRKAFMGEREQFTRDTAQKMLKMDAGLKTLERALQAEFSAVDWQKLQTEDPVAFNSQFVAYQQRYALLQDIAGQIAQEQQAFRAQQDEQQKAWLTEQRKLFAAKIPEWADEGKRNKDRAAIAEYLKGYGISEQEFGSVQDHRHALVIRDAWRWNQLEKSKPAMLQKVKAAPKLLKPGTQQSRTAISNLALQKDRDTLKRTGRAKDAAPVLKRLLFNS